MVPSLLLTKLDNVYIQVMLFTTLWLGIIGFTDDYIKVFLKNKQGLKAIFKILGQVVLGIVVAVVMLFHEKVVVPMPKAEALKYHYAIEQEIISFDNVKNKSIEYVYVKSSLTNVPFLKGNSFDYAWLTSFLEIILVHYCGYYLYRL